MSCNCIKLLTGFEESDVLAYVVAGTDGVVVATMGFVVRSVEVVGPVVASPGVVIDSGSVPEPVKKSARNAVEDVFAVGLSVVRDSVVESSSVRRSVVESSAVWVSVVESSAVGSSVVRSSAVEVCDVGSSVVECFSAISAVVVSPAGVVGSSVAEM